jgi:hypothetical protein
MDAREDDRTRADVACARVLQRRSRRRAINYER